MVSPCRLCSAVLLSVPATSLYVSTVTIKSTIIRTTYVTVHPTPATTATACLSPLCHGRNATTFHFNDTLTLVPSYSSRATSRLPSVVTDSIVYSPSQSAPSPTGTAISAGGTPQGTSHRKAIISGLVGAIAGLLVVGALISCIMRLRRKHTEDHDDALGEKGVGPTTARTWTEAWTDLLGRAAPTTTRNHADVSVDEHHHIIRMSLTHWARPFAVGQGEGIRDSLGEHTLPLRVTNPDLPRPKTPGQASSETGGSLVKHSRSAFAAILHAGRSRSASAATTPERAALSSPVVIDPNLSRECILGQSRAPVVPSASHSSLLTPPDEEPVEDPFATPSLETPRTFAQSPSRSRQPSLAPLHIAASRTLNHVGTFLSRVRHTGNEQTTTCAISRSPGDVGPPSSLFTGYSDPFDLDKLSLSDSDLHRQLHDASESRSTRGHAYGVI